jgi:hypothetical protein
MWCPLVLHALGGACCLMFFYYDQIYPSTKRVLNLNVFSSSTQTRQIFNIWTHQASRRLRAKFL